ncbi:hypothetical protein OsI_04354 [Oryza sativa Indica Group]|uniref:Uncharacterized protein n=3 Tax=Oryza TaxID=4527 RepID=A2ZZD5_ORYSJ|nr:hypothetical protein OsI_04354 [Oryza sativa Indica Group]EAZ14082.1 hypothetical protein OsJ_04006 [Oryza sativa Japonica Group]
MASITARKNRSNVDHRFSMDSPAKTRASRSRVQCCDCQRGAVHLERRRAVREQQGGISLYDSMNVGMIKNRHGNVIIIRKKKQGPANSDAGTDAPMCPSA